MPTIKALSDSNIVYSCFDLPNYIDAEPLVGLRWAMPTLLD